MNYLILLIHFLSFSPNILPVTSCGEVPDNLCQILGEDQMVARFKVLTNSLVSMTVAVEEVLTNHTTADTITIVNGDYMSEFPIASISSCFPGETYVARMSSEPFEGQYYIYLCGFSFVKVVNDSLSNIFPCEGKIAYGDFTDRFYDCQELENIPLFGKIFDWKNQEAGIANLPLEWYGQFVETSENGEFSCVFVDSELLSPINSQLLVCPSSDSILHHQISIRDLIAIQKHITGLHPFHRPEQLIAADVDGSQSIDIQDIIHIRRVLLHTEESFPIMKSWTFVRKDYNWHNPAAPWAELEDEEEVPECEMFYFSSNGNPPMFIPKIEMIAIKLGDVTGD